MQPDFGVAAGLERAMRTGALFPKGQLNCRSLGSAPNEQPHLGPTKSVGWASPGFFGPRTLVRTWGTRPVRGGRYCSLLP